MKKIHIPTLKFHTIYTIFLALLFLISVLIFPDITLFIAVAVLILYIAGNGIIHSKKNELQRDSLIEYSLVGVVALVVLLGAIL